MNALSAGLLAALDGLDPSTVWEKLRPQLRPTRFLRSDALDGATGATLTIATETGQHSGSFKYRAALAVALHSEAPRLLTASSGNFGAALAAAAANAGKGCTVVMPQQSAAVKIAAVRNHGATVNLIDTSQVSREARVAALAARDPQARRCSPYDDPYVICGNALLGAEILATAPPPEMIVSPVGGGGLSAGICVAAALLSPACQVVGAEPAQANDAARSLREGRLVANDGEPDTICDGARTPSLGKRNYAILRERLAGIVEVPEAEVARAMGILSREIQLRVEPTGALALAAVLLEPQRFRNRRVTCVVSGGNVDDAVYDRLVH